jgi:Holliday junction resolvase-like predicted endonuclease
MKDFLWSYLYEMIAFCFLIGGFFFLFLRRRFLRWGREKKFKQGRKGESIAKSWLESNGFRILSEQPELPIEFKVDGVVQFLKLRPDFCVKKDGKLAIVEVKTGTSAPNPLYMSTRRQLLEYSVHASVDEIYLFDADKKKLSKIEFNTPRDLQRVSYVFVPLFFFIVGAICAWIVVCQTD